MNHRRNGRTLVLVRFHGKAGGFTIQGDVAITLLRLMGMSGAVPGALLANDVPQALERLRRAVAAGKPPAAAADAQEEGDRVSLSARAFPLVQLLESSVRRNCDVIWEELAKSTG
jgi:uncharacterized protein DUF1840